MKNLIFGLCALVFIACDKDDCVEARGDRWNQNREVEAFHTIELSMPADAYIRLDTTLEKPVVKVVAQDNIVGRISSDVNNGKLHLFFNRCIDNNTGIRFFISTPTLRTIIASGSGDVYSEEILELDSLTVISSDYGDIDLTVNTHYLSTHLSNAGDLTLHGYTTHFQNIVDASGDIHAFEMPADTVSVTLNSSGNLSTRVQKELNVLINGIGDVHYKGIPNIVSQINGRGEIINEN